MDRQENLKQINQSLYGEIPSFLTYDFNVKKGLIDAEFARILSLTAKTFLNLENTKWQRVCLDIRTHSHLEANNNRSFEDCRCICPIPSPIPRRVSSYDACANPLLFPYGLDFNDEVVPTNDDGSSGIIDLKRTLFPFYDTFHDSLFVNTNGVISFDKAVTTFSPRPFPMDTSPIIAPFWADVDTRNGGAIYYREMTRNDDEKLAQSVDRIIRGNDITRANFELIWMFVATWDQVAFYGYSQPMSRINNTFQALLVTDGRSSFTIFNYAHIIWTTGTATLGDRNGLGGIPAQVGCNAGDGVRYYSVNGSQTDDIVDIEKKSNVDVPGRYVFNVDGESVVGQDCQSSQDRDNTGSLILYPASGSMLGGNTILVQGPCFQNTDTVKCKFLTQNNAGPNTTCQFFDVRTVSCVVPILLRIGRVYVFLSIDDGETFGFRGIYTTVSIDDVTGAIPHKVHLDTKGEYPKVVWPNNALDGNYYDIDIYVFKDNADSTGLENGRVSPTVVNYMAIESPNSDLEYELTISLDPSFKGDVGIIRISQGDEEPGEHNSFATSIWSDPFDLTIFMDLKVSNWCSAWKNTEGSNPVQLASSDGELRCPCNLKSALIDRGRFSPSPRCSNTVHESCVDEVNIVHCVRSSTPSSEGHGLECCYDTSGALTNIEDNIHAGYAHRYHHLGREPFDEIGRVPYLSHFLHDILPHRRCCKDQASCLANFTPVRPSHDCAGYQPPTPAGMNGDPHIQTLDGLKYTFNGHGEYVLMNSLDGMFVMQGRTEPLPVRGGFRAQLARTPISAGNVTKSTRFTAIAAKYSNGTNVHVSLNQIRGLAVHVTDSDSRWSQIRFDLTPIWYDAGTTIFYSEKTNVTSVSVTVAFDFGLVFIVEAANDIMYVVVGGPKTMRGNTSGLLGNWNDDVTDDLQTPDGDYLPSTSSLRVIHYDFGEKWRVSRGNSLFYYGAGTSYTTYYKPNFEPLFEQPNDIDQAMFEVCEDNPDCSFDFLVTGNEEIAKVTKQKVKKFEEIVESIKPVVVCGFIPTPSNGTKNGSVYTEGSVLVFDCNDGYSISNGSSTIYCTQEGFWSDSVPSCVKDVRLVGGASSLEGRVEVYWNNSWGTVCDDDWDVTDAHVVCRELGFTRALEAVSGGSRFGQGSGDILLNNVACLGNETRLVNCGHAEYGIQYCDHSDDAGVICINSSLVRLADGHVPYVGRVEVNIAGEWGTVCDHMWDLPDAQVVCRQLGYPSAIAAPCGAAYGEGSGRVIMEDVRCSGQETQLVECSWGVLNQHHNTCGHNEDASAVCVNNIRLVNGSKAAEGRVEVFLNGQWGTICDDSFDINDAHVVCRQLGYWEATSFQGNARFGEGNWPILLDDLQCNGNETRISDCEHVGLGVHNCLHTEDVSVLCKLKDVVRLVGGSVESEGRVEIFHDGQWGTVCVDSWDITDATVACRQLGYLRAIEAPGSAKFGPGKPSSPIFLDDVACSESDNDLRECIHQGLGVHNCSHGEDAGAVCIGSSVIRLVGGTLESKGRVEILLDGQWGTVCDDGWDQPEATVVCRQLDFPGAISAVSGSKYGQGIGPIHLNQVQCTGNERRLDRCDHVGQTSSCGHHKDSGVICQPRVRLVGGLNSFEGRVEYYYNGRWGTVCDDNWDRRDANVVCRELGFAFALEATRNTTFGYGTGIIQLSDVYCQGYETNLAACNHNGWGQHNCDHHEDVGVRCGLSDNCWYLIKAIIILGVILVLEILRLCCCYCRRLCCYYCRRLCCCYCRRSGNYDLDSQRSTAVKNDYAYPNPTYENNIYDNVCLTHATIKITK